MDAYQKQLLGHAMYVLVVGLLAGFMLAFSLIGGLEVLPTLFLDIAVFGTTDGWVRAHSGGIMNAIMIVAFAFALPQCGLAEGRAALYAKGIIFAGWANTVFYWFGNASGSRALSFTDNALGATNFFGIVGYTVAVVAAFITLYIAAQMGRSFLAKDA